MRIDLHTHSRASDGTQSPAELVRAAAGAGLDVVAITDHDSAAGWAEAAEAAEEVGIGLVRGMEISTRYDGHGVHLLGYLPDPTYPPLVEELDRILAGRADRVPRMLERLAELGVDLDPDALARLAGDTAAVGRPHVADALVEAGVVRDRGEAFRDLLGTGRPAYVGRYAAELEQMVGTVAAAGGVTVVAHPWGRSGPGPLDEAGLARLAAAGLAGIEVDHEDHDPATRGRLRAIARDLDLVVTGSSDHHGSGKDGHDLGCNTTHPAELERLLDLAARARAAAGRGVKALLAAQ